MNQQAMQSSIMALVLNIQCTSELFEVLVKNAGPWASCLIGAAKFFLCAD